jgi:hypothetical protein
MNRIKLPEGVMPILPDEPAAPLLKARARILAAYPTEKTLADIILASPDPKLRSVEEILQVISSGQEMLRIDQVFDMADDLAAWEAEKETNQKARDEALAALDVDMQKIVENVEERLKR